MSHLRTAAQVVAALGGTAAVCKLTGATRKAVWHWVGAAEKFPANQYVVMQRALKRRGASAPDWLWSMKNVERRAA